MPSKPAKPEPAPQEPPEISKAEMAAATDELSKGIQAVLIALVVWKLTSEDQDEKREIVDVKLLRTMRRWAKWHKKFFGFPWSRNKTEEKKKHKEVFSFLNKWSDDHVKTLKKKKDPDDTSLVPGGRSDLTDWADDAAHGAAARIASEAILDIEEKSGAVYEKDDTPVKLKKIWVTRSDDRVRPGHAALHGVAKDVDEPFKTWPDGKKLQHPGDPKAPFDQVVGCRCFLWFMWGP